MTVVVQVLETQLADERAVAAVNLVQGVLKVGLKLRSETTGTLWRVIGVGFVPPAAWAQGRRAISIEPLTGGQQPLASGDRLSGI